MLLSLVSAPAEPRLLSRWSFEQDGANSVDGAPAARLEGVTGTEGHQGRGLAFEDWSIKNYLKPDPGQATRVTVPHDERLNPKAPFRVSAWIYPTADPVYYGGILEKGLGFGASYRLLLLRGLKVQASVGRQHLSVRSQAPVALDAWHEIALVVDEGSMILQVDGREVGRASLSGGAPAGSEAPLVIGERFTGRIDEVEISAD